MTQRHKLDDRAYASPQPLPLYPLLTPSLAPRGKRKKKKSPIIHHHTIKPQSCLSIYISVALPSSTSTSPPEVCLTPPYNQPHKHINITSFFFFFSTFAIESAICCISGIMAC